MIPTIIVRALQDKMIPEMRAPMVIIACETFPSKEFPFPLTGPIQQILEKIGPDITKGGHKLQAFNLEKSVKRNPNYSPLNNYL